MKMNDIQKRVGSHRVLIIESEAGWGQRIDEILYFETEKDATDFVSEYDKKYNNLPYVPDWYMRASYDGVVV